MVIGAFYNPLALGSQPAVSDFTTFWCNHAKHAVCITVQHSAVHTMQ